MHDENKIAVWKSGYCVVVHIMLCNDTVQDQHLKTING